MGGGTTAAAVDHRLRPVKQLAKLQLSVREQKKDPGDLPIEGSGDPIPLPLSLHHSESHHIHHTRYPCLITTPIPLGEKVNY